MPAKAETSTSSVLSGKWKFVTISSTARNFDPGMRNSLVVQDTPAELTESTSAGRYSGSSSEDVENQNEETRGSNFAKNADDSGSPDWARSDISRQTYASDSSVRMTVVPTPTTFLPSAFAVTTSESADAGI